jgi:hypothetical protein
LRCCFHGNIPLLLAKLWLETALDHRTWQPSVL